MRTPPTIGIAVRLAVAAATMAAPCSADDSVPPSIPGLVAWYDARSLYSETSRLADGDAIEAWPDASDNGHDLTAVPTRGLPARFRTLGLNELPVVELFERTSFVVHEPFELADHSIFVVFDASEVTRALFSSDRNDQLGIVLDADGGRYQMRRGLDTWSYSPLGSRSGYAIVALVREGNALRSTVDGVRHTSDDLSNVPLRVGRLFHIRLSRAAERDARSMRLVELIFYDRALGGGEVARVNAHLAVKYGLEIHRPELEDHGPPASLPAATLSSDWERLEVQARLSATPGADLNVAEGRAIDWQTEADPAAPFRYDPEHPARLYFTRDGTAARVALEVELSADQPGTELRVVPFVNRERYLAEAGALSEPAPGSTDGRSLVLLLDATITLGDGDFVEFVAARNAGPGKVTALGGKLLASAE